MPMTGDGKSIGERLRSLRLRRGMAIERLAVQGASASLISKVENGQRIPSAKAIQLLAERLRVDPYYLEHGVRHPDRERAMALLEVAKFWRDRARFLERRLAAFDGQETADMQSLAEVLHEEAIVAGQMTVMEAIEEARKEGQRTRT